MFQPDQYLDVLTALLQQAFGERLRYVGLQGSYLRGEATESSDIDVMVVVQELTVADLDAYRAAIASLTGEERSCGFICGAEELRHWNPLEMCHLMHSTRDHFGALAELLPPWDERSVRDFVKLSVGDLYHELCHRYVHAPRERSEAQLPGTCKGVFYILQNLRMLEHGDFPATKSELLERLDGTDRQVMELALAWGRGEVPDVQEAMALLMQWCREVLVRTTKTSDG